MAARTCSGVTAASDARSFLDRLERHLATGGDAVAAVARAWDRGAPPTELAPAIDHAVHELNRHA